MTLVVAFVWFIMFPFLQLPVRFLFFLSLVYFFVQAGELRRVTKGTGRLSAPHIMCTQIKKNHTRNTLLGVCCVHLGPFVTMAPKGNSTNHVELYCEVVAFTTPISDLV